jgi:hypothetical protein
MALSGHSGLSAFMSAIGGKADIGIGVCDFRF